MKNMSKLRIPENVLKRALKNVYFILGDGAAVADELGRRHGIFAYHTCEHRYKHAQNADPEFQPELCRRDTPDLFALDPEEAMRRERGVVRDFTPMVVVDLIQFAAKHEKVICENDIDIDSIIQVATHVVAISNEKSWDVFIGQYEKAIRQRNIPEDEKESLVRGLNDGWKNGKPENPRGAMQYGIKQFICDENSSVAQMADLVAEYFGWHDAQVD